MTFSLIFSDANRHVVGGGVQSHYPFVGGTVLRARAGVGVAVSQAVGDAALAEEWPEEVRFWLGVRLAELGRPTAQDLLGPLLVRNPWRMLWLRLQSRGQRNVPQS